MANRQPTISFDEFSGLAHERGMAAKHCHDTHWQLGNGDDLLVDFWPTARKFRERHAERTSRGDYGDAMDAAYAILHPRRVPQKNGEHKSVPADVTGRLSQLEKIADLAKHYIDNDPTRLCDMDRSRVKSALDLLLALEEAGIGLDLDVPF